VAQVAFGLLGPQMLCRHGSREGSSGFFGALRSQAHLEAPTRLLAVQRRV